MEIRFSIRENYHSICVDADRWGVTICVTNANGYKYYRIQHGSLWGTGGDYGIKSKFVPQWIQWIICLFGFAGYGDSLWAVEKYYAYHLAWIVTAYCGNADPPIVHDDIPF